MNYLLNQHKSGGVGDGVLDAPIFFHPLNYWDILQQCTPKINWHQSYYNHGIATSERAVEGASPYRSLGEVRCAAKSLRSLRGCVVQEASKAVQIFVLRF